MLVSCARPQEEKVVAASPPEPLPEAARIVREIRLTGIVEALRSSRIVVPQISGQNNRMTLTSIVPNGSHVEPGDVIAEFDLLEQVDLARTAKAKEEDLDHQIDQKLAQNRAETEKRRSDMQQADATLRKAMLEVSKAEILPEIDKQQNAIRARAAQEHIDSLKISQEQRERVDLAALKILELQRDRQKIALQRAQDNIDSLQVHSPLSGMVAHSVQYRNGQITHVQVGDQLSRGNGLVSVFDPSEMLVRCSVGEPDRVELQAGARATVYVDAYPDLALPAHFESASPIATTALGTPVKTFTAIFKLDKVDPRLMPDLSAAVVIESKPLQGKDK
jgi:multidrug resistance efflux pump